MDKQTRKTSKEIYQSLVPNSSAPSTLIQSRSAICSKMNYLQAEYPPLSKSRRNVPWITPLFPPPPSYLLTDPKESQNVSKLKHSSKTIASKQYKAIKHSIQIEIRNAYWSYIESVTFTSDFQPDNNKKLYAFVKL